MNAICHKFVDSVSTTLSTIDVTYGSEVNINSTVIEVDPTKANNHPLLSVSNS